MLESKLIIKPNKDIWWISMSVGPCFVRQVNKYIIEKNCIKIYNYC